MATNVGTFTFGEFTLNIGLTEGDETPFEIDYVDDYSTTHVFAQSLTINDETSMDLRLASKDNSSVALEAMQYQCGSGRGLDHAVENVGYIVIGKCGRNTQRVTIEFQTSTDIYGWEIDGNRIYSNSNFKTRIYFFVC